MKKNILIVFLFAMVFQGISQVGINDTGSAPDPNAMLDVSSSYKVFLPPRMTSAQRDAIVTPPPGAMIFNTDLGCMEYFRGSGSGWYSICPVLPTVSTNTVSNISGISAVSGGNIINDGGATVTVRGVCWSTFQNPTTADNASSDGLGIGSFTSSLSGLSVGTTYYIRAYATNSVGTAYGNEINFTTYNYPELTTTIVSTFYGFNAIGGGNVSSDGGASVTARGVCWSTSQNPTIVGSFASSGIGLGSFTANMGSLSSGTLYYVRAYATNSVGTSYGNEVSFTTTAGTVLSFTTSGNTTWTVPTGVTTTNVLVVAGGGGGGGSTAGGGGAGGLVYYGSQSPNAGTFFNVTPGASVAITVGAGGTGSRTASAGTPDNTAGGNSVFGTITAIGGGYGASGMSGGGRVASSGGSGGGGGLYYENVPNPMSVGNGTAGQGNSGGTGTFTSDTNTWLGGGGGGAGGQGGSWSLVPKTGGQGGPGLTYNISGSSQSYAGGGGGGGTNGGGAGGIGGGGAGITGGINGTNGTPNTGGGGGGSDLYQTGSGGNGGSGIVIVRY